MIGFNQKEIRELYDNLQAVTEDLNNAIYAGNESVTNMVELGSELGKALVRLDFMTVLVGEKLTELQKHD